MRCFPVQEYVGVLLNFLNKLPRQLPAELFCFLVLLVFTKLDSHLRCVPDRVRDEVFLVAWVALLAAHSCLACSGLQLLFQTRIWGSCQDTRGTTASCYKVLLCADRAQPSGAGSGLYQHSAVVQRVWLVEGC